MCLCKELLVSAIKKPWFCIVKILLKNLNTEKIETPSPKIVNSIYKKQHHIFTLISLRCKPKRCPINLYHRKIFSYYKILIKKIWELVVTLKENNWINILDPLRITMTWSFFRALNFYWICLRCLHSSKSGSIDLFFPHLKSPVFSSQGLK